MKERPPKGIRFISIVLVIGALSGVSILVRPDSKMIYFGQIFGGILFKLYYLAMSLIHIVVAIGVYKLRRWSLIGFTVLSVYFVIIAAINIAVTKLDTLIETGWKLSDSTMTAFYTIQVVVIIFSIDLSPPPLVEDPDRFYRSGEKKYR